MIELVNFLPKNERKRDETWGLQVGVSRLRELEVCLRKKTSCEKSAELGRCSTRHIYRPTRLCECLFNLKNQSW